MENKYIRLLQFLINTDVDGDFGPNSKRAADDLIQRIDLLFADWQKVTRKEVKSNGNDNAI